MNWGNKIILGLGSFMLFIVITVIYMVSKDSDTLIDDNYYEASLSYDEVYASKQNLLRDDAKPILKVQHDTLTISFVDVNNEGTILFKRPSDGALDINFPFTTKDKVFKMPIASFKKGNWNVEISWKHNNVNYIHNQPLYIQ
ncbi:MAG: FixH family protein [Sphingobacterium composti]|uniref:FixH family protein n=1 Tax=Sphingobacterium composti TaxID=363260 RepID=UPI00135AB092|nr:FixH family protein [Sphingobacterium composti Ten et al. 2007 non Yoo et al. 2007]